VIFLIARAFQVSGQFLDQLRGLWGLQALVVDPDQDGSVAFADVNSAGTLFTAANFVVARQVHVLDSTAHQSTGLEHRGIFHSHEDLINFRAGDLQR